MFDKEFPMNITSEPMTAKFDKRKLVYLTPHCNNDLETFSHDDIYIIGAMVDKSNHEPLSLAKAKKQGLRMARLPLDKYIDWSSGSGKSLTINQMVNILLDLKKHGEWQRALRFVPRRKMADHQRDSRNAYQQSNYSKQQEEGTRQRSWTSNKNLDSSEYQTEGNWVQNRQKNKSYQPSFAEDRQQWNSNNRFQKNFDDRRQRIFDIQSKIDFEEDINPNRQAEKPFVKKSKPSQERKHFEKYQFDLNTWGSSTKKNNEN